MSPFKHNYRHHKHTLKSLGLSLGLMTFLVYLPVSPVKSQELENCQDENSTGESTRKKRRRPGGVNRDCKRKVIEVNTETGEVNIVEQHEEQKPRTFLPRKFSTTAKPKIEQFKALTPIPDRWRIVDSLGYQNRWYDPYNQNVLKADKPINSDDWFFNLDVISDTVFESQERSTENRQTGLAGSSASNDMGFRHHDFFNQNLAVGMVYYQGNTTFKPPNFQFRFMPVLNYNDSTARHNRSNSHIGIQTLYIEKYLRDVSSNYDFDSIRIGIQPMTSDFRGFVLLDSPFGVRLFGTRNNYKYQYNIGLFRRLQKKQVSGLNEANLSFRDDEVFMANLYLQDKPKSGITSQVSLIHNRNRDTDFSTTSRSYDVTYLGLGADGHWGRLNLSTTAYYAFGRESVRTDEPYRSDISAYFLASELSVDFDWLRFSASFLYASGDDDPFDKKSNGFDAIDENPLFAGGDSSYWIRQTNVLSTATEHIALSSRNGLLNSLRHNGINSQSNFSNPGTALIGLGAEFELLPELSLTMNANYLRLNETAPFTTIRPDSVTSKNLGVDVSIAAVYRPFNSQNMVFRLSYAKLFAGNGFRQLMGAGNPDALLLNVILTY